MSVGFGFSADDFIAALGLVKAVISALEDTGHVNAEYRELLSELRSLETALITSTFIYFQHRNRPMRETLLGKPYFTVPFAQELVR